MVPIEQKEQSPKIQSPLIFQIIKKYDEVDKGYHSRRVFTVNFIIDKKANSSWKKKLLYHISYNVSQEGPVPFL